MTRRATPPKGGRFSSPASLLLGLLLLLAALPAKAVDAAGELRYGQGLLWRIDTPGIAPSYLYGTMHSTDPAILTLPAPVAEAFARTSSLTLEMVMDAQVRQKLGQAMALTDGRTLDGIIGPERFAAAVAIGAQYDLPPQAIRLFEPWAAMTLFSLTPEEFRRNAAGIHPLDHSLQVEARRRGKTVYGLESVEEQIAVFADIPEADQIALLDTVLRDHPRIEEWFAVMKSAYLAGDIATIYGIMSKQAVGIDPAIAASFKDRLIVARNHRMAERMTGLLDAGNAFIAVGALHLPGDEGILRLLELEGRRVKRIH